MNPKVSIFETCCKNEVILKQGINYFIEHISSTSEYQCAPQLCHLFQKIASIKTDLPKHWKFRV